MTSGSLNSGSQQSHGTTPATTSSGASGANQPGSAPTVSQANSNFSSSTAGSPGQGSDSASPSSSSTPPSPASSRNLGAIIGGAAAGSFAIILAVVFLLCRRCRHRGSRFDGDQSSSIRPYVQADSPQSRANVGHIQPSPAPIEIRQRTSQDFLTLSSSPPSMAGAALSHGHDVAEDGLLLENVTRNHDSLAAQASIRRGSSRPPTYAPLRHPARIVLASKWSEDSPMLTSAVSPLASQNTSEPTTALQTSARATADASSPRNHEHWEPSAPSEYSEEAPPRYYF